MTIQEACRKLGLDERVAQILEVRGYKKIYAHQQTAVKSDLFKGKNGVLSMPTASGKTLIAELVMLLSILNNNGKCLYVVPLKALASEKYEDFKDKYASLGIKVAMATGDYDVPSNYLAGYHIIIATSEKVDSLLRFRARWLLNTITVGIFDEIHLIDDESRGPTLEILIARLKQLNSKIQLVGLSATIKNAPQIAKWLEAECFISSWRPVALKEGVYFDKHIIFDDKSKRKVSIAGATELNSLCLETIKESGQVLLFVNTRRSTQTEARRLAPDMGATLAPAARKELARISQKITGTSQEPTKIRRELAGCVREGVAFHHAGLKYNQRKLIEDAFKNNIIKVICATPTLAAGVNLPARRVIIRDSKRFASGFGSQHIAVFEYKQMRGRAGRPKYDKLGESILIAKSEDDLDELMTKFVLAEPEPIISKLGQENALRMHILSSISSGYVSTHKGLMDFLSHTFFAQQEDEDELDYMIERIIDFLIMEEMIVEENTRYRATAFGNLISRLYIDPISGVILKKGLINSVKKDLSPVSALQLIAICPDVSTLRITKKNKDEVEMFFGLHHDEFLLPFNDYFSRSDYISYLEAVKTAMMLSNWIEEVKEDEVCDEFSVGPGDIRRLVESANWLIYASKEISRLFKIYKAVPKLDKLETRVKYGIKEELLELVSLRGIGRIRARNLYQAGIRRLSDIKKAGPNKLMKTARLGKTLISDIKKQLEKKSIKTSIQ